MAENLANDFATTLAGAVDNSTGTLTVVLASGAPAPNFRIRVDDELMLVTAVAGTTWTATRGIEGTAAASHASGAVVAHVLTAGALAALFADHAPAAADITDSTTVGRAVITAANAGAARTAMGAAPLASPSFTGDVGAPAVNGAATSGFRNKINNGCCRISKKGSGAAAVGWNRFGADGISTFIGGWSAVTGTIAVENAADSSRTSSGGTHVTNITAATGSVGYIIYIVRIEAADALELAGKPFTASARITAWTKQIDDVQINILKANTFHNFDATTPVANVTGLGPVSASTTKDVSFSTTLTTADCANGLQIEFVCLYTSTVTAAFHCFIADLQCCAGSQRMPFELRPIAIEEELRSRYYRKQSVRVNTSSNWTCFPIGMVKTPTITGGGTGFVSTGTTADTLMCYQTAAAAQTLILDAEL